MMSPHEQIFDQGFSEAKPDVFSAIQEREIDLLLVEEFSCHPEFAKWFYGKLQSSIGESSWDSFECLAKHSVGSSGIGAGETDLWVEIWGITTTQEHQRILLLIENKISATFTPNQPERYRQRSELERRNYDKVYTVLIAPLGYLRTCSLELFDSMVPYEEIRGFIRKSALITNHCGLRSRLEHRASMLEHAITGYRRSGGQGIIYSETNTEFFGKCYELIASEYSTRLDPWPNKKRGKGSNAINFRFRGRDRLMSACKDDRMELFLSLRFPDGQTVIRFHHWPSYATFLIERFQSSVPDGMSVNLARSRKTVDVVLGGLPIIDITGVFEAQIPNLRISLDRMVELKEWIEGKVGEIECWLHEFDAKRLSIGKS